MVLSAAPCRFTPPTKTGGRQEVVLRTLALADLNSRFSGYPTKMESHRQVEWAVQNPAGRRHEIRYHERQVLVISRPRISGGACPSKMCRPRHLAAADIAPAR